VHLSAPFRFLAVFLLLLPAAASARPGAESAVATSAAYPVSSIVVGFVGGFVRHDNPRHGPVQLAQSIRHNAPKDTYVQVFENRHRKTAYQTVIRLLDTDHDGVLSDAEKAHSHIILFGHSWGGAAVVLLARDLRRNHIPVSLTVQVDSVAKLWQNDAVIPDNVTEAINFYQPHGFIHGRPLITAADTTKTQILGNHLVDYKKSPVECADTLSWYDRVFTPGHAQSECDPGVWSQVENLIRQHLTQPTNTASANPQP